MLDIYQIVLLVSLFCLAIGYGLYFRKKKKVAIATYNSLVKRIWEKVYEFERLLIGVTETLGDKNKNGLILVNKLESLFTVNEGMKAEVEEYKVKLEQLFNAYEVTKAEGDEYKHKLSNLESTLQKYEDIVFNLREEIKKKDFDITQLKKGKELNLTAIKGDVEATLADMGEPQTVYEAGVFNGFCAFAKVVFPDLTEDSTVFSDPSKFQQPQNCRPRDNKGRYIKQSTV